MRNRLQRKTVSNKNGLRATALGFFLWLAAACGVSHATVYLPSMKIGTAALISPTDANNWYNSQPGHSGSSDGLSEWTGVATPTPPEIADLARALKYDPDLIFQYVENNIRTVWMYGLQKGALGAEIDKSGTPFDQAELMVALLRQIPTPPAVSYVAGTVALNGSQFTAWTNITNELAACQLLSSGGFPAMINGKTATTCAASFSASVAVSTVEMAHIWVRVTIPGSDTAGCSASDICVFDPSFKNYTWKSGLNLATAMQFTSGDPLNAVKTGNYASGTTSNAHWANALNTTDTGGLYPLLKSYGSHMGSWLDNHNMLGAQIEDVVGGSVINPVTAPVRQAALPYADSNPPYTPHVWTPPADPARYNAIRNIYRTTLEVHGWTNDISGNDHSMFDPVFYVDEIYGRALTVETDYTYEGIYGGPKQCGTDLYKQLCNYPDNRITLELDNAPLANVPTYVNPGSGAITARGQPAHITLVANHPYAASANPQSTQATGGYMDATVDKPVVLITSLAIVHGWGDVSSTLFSKLSDERAQEVRLPKPVVPPYCYNSQTEFCPSMYFPPAGNFGRLKTAAGWLAQATKAGQLNAAIANSIQQNHHMLGFLYGDNHLVPTYNRGPVYLPDQVENDSFDRLDVNSAISLTSRDADAGKRRAAIQSFATASAALEGSLSGQLADVPDTVSTATRFEWGNAPPADPDSRSHQNPFSLVPQRFYLFDSTNTDTRKGLLTSEGHSNGNCPDSDGITKWTTEPGQPTEIATTQCQNWIDKLDMWLGNYVTAGFSIVSSREAFLGPGQRAGAYYAHDTDCGPVPCNYTHDDSRQRGGAFIATKYDDNGDPTEIAHVVLAISDYSVLGSTLVTKGGGSGASEPDGRANYNPSEAADILKARFVDRSNALGVNLSNGSLSYSSPVSLRVGNGGFPYELTATFNWQPGPPPTTNFGKIAMSDPQPGWKLNWLNKLSISGSGMEAMGQSDIRGAIGAIVSFYAAQDIYNNTPVSPVREAAATLAEAWWIHQTMGNIATVEMGGDSRQFVKAFSGVWFLPGSNFATLTQTGSRIPYEQTCLTGAIPEPYALARGWDDSNISFTVTNQHGDTETFGYWSETYQLSDDQTDCGQLRGFRLTNWNFPYGASITPVYANDTLTEVDNSAGRRLLIALPDAADPGSITNGLTGGDARSISLGAISTALYPNMTDAMGNLTKFDFIGPLAASPTQRPIPYSLLYDVFTPEKITADVEYAYDSEGRIEQVFDAQSLVAGSNRPPYDFYIADGTRGERDDPLNQPYVVDYDTYGHPARYTDEVGAITLALFDSRSRPVHYQYPEGDCDVFAYDKQNNTTDFWRAGVSANCGTGSALHVSATYDFDWNKPLTITDARQNTTNFTYYGTDTGQCPGNGGSLLCVATRPPAVTGGPQPTYQYFYTVQGKLDHSIDPDRVTTQNGYDTVAGNFNLLSTIVDPGAGSHLKLTTTFGYDANGDRTSMIDPNLVQTDYCFDYDRRQTETRHHDGGGTSGLLAAERTKFDAIGRDYEDDRATGVSGIGACNQGGGTWIAAKQTAYTATSKVHIVTDADNKQTITDYDDDDRVSTVTDPVQRKTHFRYCSAGVVNCAANQVRAEYRAWSAGTDCSIPGTLQECYRGMSYLPDGELWHLRDANDNLTVYGYDDFVRQTTTTFPDSTYEQLTLDENGNVTVRRNRAGETLSYQYNALNWLTQKCIPAAGGSCPSSPAVTDYWTYLLSGKIDTICEASDCSSGNKIDYNYDTAGRLNQVITHITGFAIDRGLTYTLDADGNRVQLKWPQYDGGYTVSYCYDHLNRMTGAYELPTDPNQCDSGTLLATYAYNTLSRRKSVTYASTASMAYTWSDAGDLLTLNHNMNGGANDPHYIFTYTNAHELQTETISDGDYAWQPSTTPGTTAYAAANTLNQYPSVNGTSFGYDPKGNLTSDGTWAFGYDAENRLLTANKTAGGTVAASYAYDPLGRRNHKSGTGVNERYFLIDGDEDVLEYDGSKNPVAFYVPGPAIDEPIVMSTPNGGGTYAHQYFHTNHQGSVIATSDDSGAKQGGPYVYDPYGNCFKGAVSCANLGTLPFAFTGQRLDWETGLYYYRARCYSPTLGRFCQTDPVGYEADPNLYTYVGNNPIDGTDPNGTCPSNVNCADTEGLGGVQGIDVTNGGGIGSSKNMQFTADIGSLAGASSTGGQGTASRSGQASLPQSAANGTNCPGCYQLAANGIPQVTLNRLQGLKAEDQAAKELVGLGFSVTRYVVFKDPATGRTAVIDMIAHLEGKGPSGGGSAYIFVEVKSGNGRLTVNQTAVATALRNGTAIPVGQNARTVGLIPGQPTGPQVGPVFLVTQGYPGAGQ